MFSKEMATLFVFLASYAAFAQQPSVPPPSASISGGTLHAASLIKLAQGWDSHGYGNCISVGSDNVGPLLNNKCDAYLAVLYTDDNQCRVGCKVYIHAHDSERITSPRVHHVEACRSPAIPHLQTDGSYICKP
jgi:hypothetical protein